MVERNMTCANDSDRDLSIVICTHDRSHDLVECIEAIVRQPGGREVELIVVDSASNRDHRQRLERMRASHANLTLIRLEQAGLSVARNAGVERARGDWIAFLDDDAVPSSTWLSHASRIAAASPSDVGAVGGRIVPRWPGDKPEHVGQRWLMFLSCIEATTQPNQRRPECYGANLMFRRTFLLELSGFATDLGRTAGNLLSGEEPLVFEALLQHGKRILYDGELVVEHKIGAERLARRWIRRRAYWGGITEVVMTKKLGLRPPRHLHPLKVIASIPVLAVLASLRDPDSDRYIRMWYAIGVLGAKWKSDRTNV